MYNEIPYTWKPLRLIILTHNNVFNRHCCKKSRYTNFCTINSRPLAYRVKINPTTRCNRKLLMEYCKLVIDSAV